MKKTGILGGTLNPIHVGHLIIAQAAKEQLQLDKVLFMPTGCPPHKNTDIIADKRHRSTMIKMAIESNPDFAFSDVELKRDGIIYTVDTLKILKEQNPKEQFFFIMGADSLLAIESWKKPEDIFRLCTVVVADRDEQEGKLLDMISYLQNKYQGEIVFVKAPLVDISSSDIRDKVRMNCSIKYLVDDKVEKYIYENKLYVD